MSELNMTISPCPLCGAIPTLSGRDVRGRDREVVQTVKHGFDPNETDWRKNCPLSLLIFPLELWNRRPSENPTERGETPETAKWKRRWARRIEEARTVFAGHSHRVDSDDKTGCDILRTAEQILEYSETLERRLRAAHIEIDLMKSRGAHYSPPLTDEEREAMEDAITWKGSSPASHYAAILARALSRVMGNGVEG